MSESISTCGLACEILERTDDGNELAPEHLKLLEHAVNGFLNETGMKVFATLHAQVVEGAYTKPWLQGVEHLTRDHEGYVYWKGHHVDHWSGDLPYSARGKTEAIELAKRCQIVEGRGDTPSVGNVIWLWEEEE